jgi:hypothetical protein
MHILFSFEDKQNTKLHLMANNFPTITEMLNLIYDLNDKKTNEEWMAATAMLNEMQVICNVMQTCINL